MEGLASLLSAAEIGGGELGAVTSFASPAPGVADASGGSESRQYHKMACGKYRLFRLLPLGTANPSRCIKCELCRNTEASEDPLYPGFQREWAYYSKTAPEKTEGRVCFYSTMTHRLRYRAWTRSELTSSLAQSQDAFDEFLALEQKIISLKRQGHLDFDLTALPMPVQVVSTSKRKAVDIWEDFDIITEPAWKAAHANMGFKESGVAHLVEDHEVNPGVFVKGIAQRRGDEGVFRMRKRFGNEVEHKSVIDGGRPQIDEQQGGANFEHLVGKSEKKRAAASAADLENLFLAAKAAKATSEKDPTEVREQLSGAASFSAAPSAEGMAHEDAADYALECMRSGRKKPPPSKRSSATVRGGAGDGDSSTPASSAKKPKKSPAMLLVQREKSEKELLELLVKFKKQNIATGPLRNKLKNLQSTKERCEQELSDRTDEVGEVGETIYSLAQAYTAAKAVLGAQLSFVNNMDKQPVADFLHEMVLAKKSPHVRDNLPVEYIEVDAKIAAYRAIAENNFEDLAAVLSEDGVKERIGADASPADVEAFRAAIANKLICESLRQPGNMCEKFILSWIAPVLDRQLVGAELQSQMESISKIVTAADPAKQSTDLLTEDQLREVKSCQRGPLFQFRVSKLGTRMLAALATRAHEERSNLVFSRKWKQFADDMDSKVVPLSFAHADAGRILSNFDSHADALNLRLQTLNFLKDVPSNFVFNPPRADIMRKWHSFLDMAFLQVMGAAFDMVDTAASRACGASLGANPSEFESIRARFVCLDFLSQLMNTGNASAGQRMTRSKQALDTVVSLLEVFENTRRAGVDAQQCALVSTLVAELQSHAEVDSQAPGPDRVQGGALAQCKNALQIVCNLHGLRAASCRGCSDFAGTLLKQCEREVDTAVDSGLKAFNATLVAQGCLPFAQACEASGHDPVDVFMPFSLDRSSLKEKLLHEATVDVIKTVSAHDRDESKFAQARALLLAWAPERLRELQVTAGFSDCQRLFCRAVVAWMKGVMQGPPPQEAFQVALQSPKAKSAPGPPFVCAELLSLLAELNAKAATLAIGDCPAPAQKILHPSAAGLSKKVLAASDIIAQTTVEHLCVGLQFGMTAISSYMPRGEWKNYALESPNDAMIQEELLGNPHHVKMASVAEWLTSQVELIDGAPKDLGAVSFDDAVLSACRTLIAQVRQLVGAACAYQVVFRGSKDLLSVDARADAVQKVKDALKSNNIELARGVVDRLTVFVSRGPLGSEAGASPAATASSPPSSSPAGAASSAGAPPTAPVT